MNRKYSQEDSNLKQGKTEQKELAENLQFMRLAIEKTRRDFDPGAAIFITWGLLCLIGYTATHFLIAQQAYDKINTVWFSLYGIGVPSSIFFGYRISKRQNMQGVVPYIYIQIAWIWGIMIVSGIAFGTFGLGRSFFNDINFLWAWIYAISLSMTGVVYSKEWLMGGIAIFAGMVAAVFLKQYACLILGFAMCAGCVIPSLITQKRLRNVEKENA
jgi:hypothetical protein